MANESNFPLQWNDLADPRQPVDEGSITVVELQEPEWRKIVQKHFANSKEPWLDTLGRDVLDGVGSNDAHEATKAGLEEIRRQIAACMRRPLVILYACLGFQIRGQGRRWLLVLPCGALAIVWVESSRNRLKTCYFTGAVAVKPREQRWRHALRQQVQEYATYDEDNRSYRYPGANERKEVSVVGATCELRYAIRFISTDAWGFTSNEPGAVWNGPKWNWSEFESCSMKESTQVEPTPEDA